MSTAKSVVAAGSRVAVLAGLLLPTLVASQNDVTISYLQGQMPVATDAVQTIGPDLFGDRVNLYNGTLTFEHTDLQLPGNNALPVALTRQHIPGRSWRVRGSMADWDIQTPRIEGRFSALEGWITASGGTNRCSGFSDPPTVAQASAGRIVGYISMDYWQGTNIVVPGQGSQELLVRESGYADTPTDGRAYPLVTRNQWQIGCLLSPGVSNGAGEGFFAVSPDGVRYRFDWMASRQQTGIKKAGATLGTRDFYLMATEVTDRFGNWVRYRYDPAQPLNLLSIESSDGRLITLSYAAGFLSSASDGTRTYFYSYSAQGDLSTVQQPDGSRWTFDLRPMLSNPFILIGEGANCDNSGDSTSEVLVGTITHPSGAVGKFTTSFLVHGRTYVQRVCNYYPGSRTFTIGPVWPQYTTNQGLVSKQITGPGLAPLTWRYDHTSIGGWQNCTTCPDRKEVTVTDPSGAVTRHVYGNRWRVNEGQLLQVDEGWNGNTALKTVTYRYRLPISPPSYPDQFGDSFVFNSDYLATRNRPLDQRITTQQGVSFTWEAAAAQEGFDPLARPLKVSRFSSLGYTKTETTTYADNKALWVMGQEASLADSYGRLVRRATYDNLATALPSAKFSFERLLESLTYWPDGTVKDRTDPVGRVTTLYNYKRGLPQNVTHRDGTTESAIVDNIGKVRQHTNAAGTTTLFDYDTMGRIARVDHPNEPNLQYHPTFNAFESVPDLEHGLPPGHWRQITTTGMPSPCAGTTRCGASG